MKPFKLMILSISFLSNISQMCYGQISNINARLSEEQGCEAIVSDLQGTWKFEKAYSRAFDGQVYDADSNLVPGWRTYQVTDITGSKITYRFDQLKAAILYDNKDGTVSSGSYDYYASDNNNTDHRFFFVIVGSTMQEQHLPGAIFYIEAIGDGTMTISPMYNEDIHVVYRKE